MKVYKFGGTPVGTVERMKHVAELVSDSTPKIVVLSATAGTTNHLEQIAADLFNRETEPAHEKITRLEFQFIDFANELLKNDSIKREAIDYILDRFQQLWGFISNEFTSVEEKDVLAQGELISTALMHFCLREQNIPSVLLSAFDFMRTGPEGEPDMGYIEEKLQEQLARYPGIRLFITQGYICKNAYNETDNLKRGGSDYTASLIGAAIHAEEIQIWTDIDGMHNNDPREVSGTRSVKHLSFNEAEQLAFYGAKILHPFCIAPARKRNIPVRLLNSMNPTAEGTLISDRQDDNIIKAIAAKDNIFYIKFKTKHDLCPYQFISRIFDVFAKYRTPLCLLVSSNQDVSVAIDYNECLSKILSELSQCAKIQIEDRMSIVSVVGNMHWQYTGVEAQIVKALKNIPIRMISYGSNDSDVAFVIRTEDKKRALQTLSNKLFKPELYKAER
ncbi:MAG: aspartate kinase [Bacteroides sp.]|nr:aspartate kinase [Bacteroides sp.]